MLLILAVMYLVLATCCTGYTLDAMFFDEDEDEGPPLPLCAILGFFLGPFFILAAVLIGFGRLVDPRYID